jgi:hypothetical protein
MKLEQLGPWPWIMTLSLVAGALVIMYFNQLIPESIAGGGIAALAAVLASAYVLIATRDSPGARWPGIAGAAAVLAIGSLPPLVSVFPGSPLAEGDLSKPGDRLALPDAAHGSVRVLVHGGLAGSEEATVSFRLAAGDEPLSGELVRKIGYTRMRKGGRSRVSNELNSEYLWGRIAPAAKELELAQLQGPLRGQLHVAVYRDYFPPVIEESAAIAIVLLMAYVAARLGWSAGTVIATGLMACFGAIVYVNATPDSAIRPEMGAAFMSLIMGGLGGAILASIARRFFARRAAV